MNCPNCGLLQPEGATECQGCQIIFDKWRKRQEGPKPAAPAAQPVEAKAAEGGGLSLSVSGIALSALIAVGGPLTYKFVGKGIAERYVMAQLERNKVEDPGKALTAAGQIMNFYIPGGAEGLFASEGSLLGMRMRVAGVGNRKEGVLLLMMALSGLDVGPEESLQSFKKNIAGRLKISSSQVKKDRLGAETVDISVDRGALPLEAKQSPTGRAIDLPMVSYLGSVKCAKDSVTVWSMGLGDDGERQVSEVFASLKCR